MNEEWMNDGARKVFTQYSIWFGTWEVNPKFSRSQPGEAAEQMVLATTSYARRNYMRTIYILLLMTSYQRLEGVLNTGTTAVCQGGGG